MLGAIDQVHRHTGLESAELLAKAARAHYSLNEDKKAEADVQRALTLKPGCASAHVMLGLLRYKQDKADDAIAALRMAADEDKASTEALANLAGIYEAKQQPAKALEIYKEILTRDPNDAGAKAKVKPGGK